MKVIVSGKIGNFDEGQELTSQANIVKYFRILLNEGRDEADQTKLTAKQIMSAVSDAGDVLDSDAEINVIEALEALEQSGEEEPDSREQVVTADEAKLEQASAAEFAAKLDKDATDALAEAWTIKRRSGVMPLVHMLNLLRCWGKDGMASAPIGGSVKMDVSGKYVLAIKHSKDNFTVLPPAVQNLRPDKYTVDGTDGRKHPMSFYGDVFDATPNGIELAKQLAICDGALQSPQAAGTPKELVDKDKFEIEAEKKAVKDARTFQIGQLRKAVQCYRQLEAINNLPLAGAYVVTTGRNGHTKVRETPLPIVIHNWMDDPAGNKDQNGNVIRHMTAQLPVSIGKFLKYDVAKAAELGGNRAALEKTTERDTEEAKKKKQAVSEGLNIFIRNTKQFMSAVAEMSKLYEDTKFMGEMVAELTKPDTDPELVSIFDAARIFEYFKDKEPYQKRVLAYRESGKPVAGPVAKKVA